MKTGAVIFAQNNNTVDYVKLAVFASERVNRYLDIPVTLITDSKEYLLESYPNNNFDQIIELPATKGTQNKRFNDGSFSSKILPWKNQSRSSVYDLTPYDRTLVIDSDYILNSSLLKSALANDYDFQIYRNSVDIAYNRDKTEFDRINEYTIPFYWATVFIFQKNIITQAFFDLISHIKNNWQYFRLLYNIKDSLYRNDFAFSIAIHIMNGKTNSDFAIDLPGSMVYAMDKDILLNAKDNKMQFLTQKKDYLGEYLLTKTSGIDVHVMNKLSLSRYIDGGKGV
jgi:hypothetical protein